MGDLDREPCAENFDVEVSFMANAAEPSPTATEVAMAVARALRHDYNVVVVKAVKR